MASSSIRSSRSGLARAKNSLPTALVPGGEILPRGSYERDTLVVARELLGKLLLVREARSGGYTVSRIVEAEGYHGDDPAAHCARGETARCAVMFGDPGVAYVYFIYGMYEML